MTDSCHRRVTLEKEYDKGMIKAPPNERKSCFDPSNRIGGVTMKRLLLILTALIMILFTSVALADEDPDAVILEWEGKYGDQRLWDYQVNAAFAEQESWRYAWNPSMRPMLPDPDAIPVEEAEKLAYLLIPQYGSEINAERLESLTCVVSSYRKPEDDTGSYWSKNGTWVIDFWDTQGEEPLSVCTICIDAHTGIPSALLLSSGIHYVGAPDNAKVVTGTEG